MVVSKISEKFIDNFTSPSTHIRSIILQSLKKNSSPNTSLERNAIAIIMEGVKKNRIHLKIRKLHR